jgi:hypothetical protein
MGLLEHGEWKKPSGPMAGGTPLPSLPGGLFLKRNANPILFVL